MTSLLQEKFSIWWNILVDGECQNFSGIRDTTSASLDSFDSRTDLHDPGVVRAGLEHDLAAARAARLDVDEGAHRPRPPAPQALFISLAALTPVPVWPLYDPHIRRSLIEALYSLIINTAAPPFYY